MARKKEDPKFSLRPLQTAAKETVDANAEVIGEKLVATLKTLIKEGANAQENKALKLQILKIQRDLRTDDKNTKLTAKILKEYHDVAEKVQTLKQTALHTKVGQALSVGKDVVASREHVVELLEELRDRKAEQNKHFAKISGDLKTGLVSFLGPAAPLIHTFNQLRAEYSDEFKKAGKWLGVERIRNMILLKRLDDGSVAERISFQRMLDSTKKALDKLGQSMGGAFRTAFDWLAKTRIGKVVGSALSGVRKVVGALGGRIGKFFGKVGGKVGGKLGKVGNVLGKLGKFAGRAGRVFGKIGGLAADALGPIGGVIGLGDIFMNSRDKGKTGEGAFGDYLQGGLSGMEVGALAGPIGAAVGLALGLAATAITRNWSTIKDAMSTGWDKITSVFKGGWSDLLDFKNDAVKYIGGVWDTVKAKAAAVVKWFSDHIPGFDMLTAPVKSTVDAAKQVASSVAGNISSSVATAASGILPSVQGAANWVSSNIGGPIASAAQGVSNFVGKLAMPGGDVGDAISNAAKVTGVSQSYLLAEASQESGFRSDASAGTSSAKGLFQFTKSTWADMVKKYGAQYGIGLGDIMDPRKNAIMGALFARDNAKELARKGLAGGPTELYAAHFLGVGGAEKLLSAMKQNPNISAASILPDAAASNKTVFFNRDGSPKTVAQVYQFLNDKVGAKATAYAQVTGEAKATPKGDNYDRVASQKPGADVTVQHPDKGGGAAGASPSASKGTTINDMPLAVGSMPFLVMQSSMIG